MVNILILDDDTLYCNEFSSYLKTKEYIGNVFTANNAEESNAILSNKDVDLILLDIGMPVVDGLTYLEQLNSSDKGRPNVIFISNMKNQFIINRAFDLGCSYYLCKPINYDYVYSIIITFFNTDTQNDNENPIIKLLNSYNLNSNSVGFKYIYQSAELLSSLPNSMHSGIDGISNILSLKINQNPSYIKWHLCRSLNLILKNQPLLNKLKESKDVSPYNVLYNLILDFNKRAN